MECASRILFFIIIGYMTGTVTECQKSQYLVLSESRKTGMEGTLLQVNCTAHVMSPLDLLKWIPGHEGQTDIQQAYLTNTTVVMTISSLNGSDAGRYKCLLVMADGREETAEFELLVRRRGSNAATCSITQFKCKKTKHCIFLRYRCDGKDDCGDGSDEVCESNPCLNKFRCNNSRCVDNQDVCNHVDNCGDRSDEAPSCILDKSLSTTQATTEDSQFGWLKITMSTVIASTVGVVILVSFIVIVVFRIKMRRLRERRTARAFGSVYRHGESREATSSGHGDEASDQRPFLPPGSHMVALPPGSHHYGNIIVNVNNGVQYLPGYDYSLFVAVPPPYSECGTGAAGDSGNLKPQPPPYSTIDRNNTQQQTCTSGHSDNQTTRQNISVSSVQSCLGALRGPDHPGVPVPGSNETVEFTPNGGPLCRGRTPAQEFEGLSGITSTFLQSLLGSHREGVAATDNTRSGCQNLAEERSENTFAGTLLQKTPNATDCSMENPKTALNTHQSQPAPNTASNSTQTTPRTSLTANRVNLAAGGRDSKQNINLIDVKCDTNSLVCDKNISFCDKGLPTIVVEQQDVKIGIDNPDNQKNVLVSLATADVSYPDNQKNVLVSLATADVSSNVNKVSFNGTTNTSPVLTSAGEQYISHDSQSASACEEEGFEDDFGVHIFGERQVENGSDSNEHSDILHPLLPSQSDTTCHAVINEMPCEMTQSRAVKLVAKDENLTQEDSNDCGNGGCVSRLDSHSVYASQDVKKKSESGTNQSFIQNINGIVSTGNGLAFQSSIDHQSNPSAEVTVNTPYISESTDSSYTGGNKNRFSGELNLKNGCLVLESPKHTPSSQILSHLQGAYAAEQLASSSTVDEPVGNTKRPAGVVSRPSLPKFQSDFVLRYRNQPL